MWKRFSRGTGGSAAPSSSSLSYSFTPPTDPRVHVILRSTIRYPADSFDGIVHLHLPRSSEILLVEVVILGRERARIGVLAGSANFEARKTNYYQQYITVIGAVPPAVMESRRTAVSNAKSAAQRVEEMRRHSMNKQASLRARDQRRSSQADAATNNSHDSSDQPTLLYAPTSVAEEQVVRLAAGTYTFPFRVTLPDVLPPSHVITRGKEASCHLKYCVKARVLFRSGKQLHAETPFTLLTLPVPLHRWLQLHRPADAPKHFPVPALPPSAVETPGAEKLERGEAKSKQGSGRTGSSVAGHPAASDEMPTTLVMDDTAEEYELGLGGSGDDNDEAGMASHHGRNADRKTAASDMSTDTTSALERTQRRCINHKVRFHRAQVEKDEAALAAAAAAKEARQAKTASNKAAATQSDNEDADTVFAMGADGGAEASGATKKSTKPKTRMLASEIERIGFDAAPGSDSEADGEVRPRKRAAAADNNATKAEREVEREGEKGTDEGENPAEGAGQLTEEGKHAAVEEEVTVEDGTSVSPPSRTLHEPMWEHNFLMPLRTGLMSKSTVGLTLIVHANVLCAGRDKARFSAIVDNTQGGGTITKVRFSLVVRQMIRSKSETYRFSRVEAEITPQATVPKGKVARLPLAELPVPRTAPLTTFTDGGYSTTFLSIRLYSSTALKTYSRSAEVELLIVNDVVEHNKSRRLLRWTNFFVGRGIPAGAESAPTLDLNSVNLHPKVLTASDVAEAESRAAADTVESVMGDRYTASILPGGAPSVASTSRATAAATRGNPREALSPSSTALLLSQNALEGGSKKGRGKPHGGGGGPSLATKVRRVLDYTEPTYLPLEALAAAAGGAREATVHVDPMAGVNPLAMPRREADMADVFEGK